MKIIEHKGRDYVFTYSTHATLVTQAGRTLLLTDSQRIVPNSTRRVRGPWHVAEFKGRWEAEELTFVADTNANHRSAPLP